MALTTYSVGYSFAGHQANSPQTPLPGQKVDIELYGIQAAISSLASLVSAKAPLVNSVRTPVLFTAGIQASASDPVTLVTYQGSLFACVADHQTAAVFEPAKWLQIVSKGGTGSQGLVGPTGGAGAKGDAGAQGLQGPMGATIVPKGSFASFSAILAGVPSPSTGDVYVAIDTGHAWQWGGFVSTFTGSIAATTLTVPGSVTGPALGINSVVDGSGVTAGSWLTAGSGASWTITPSQTVASTAMSAGTWVDLGVPGSFGVDQKLRQLGYGGADYFTDVLTTLTPVNRTDGAAATETITHAGGGLSIAQSTGSRIFSYPITRTLGAKYNKVTLSCVTSVAGAGTGFGIELSDGGSTWLVAHYATNGRINFAAGGSATAPSLLTGLPTWSAGATLTFVLGLDSSGNVQLTVSNGTQTGGCAFPVPTACTTLSLVQYGTTTAVWSMSQEAVSSAASNRIASAISSSTPAAQSNFAQLSGLLEVPKPSQITLPVLYSAKFYQDPATGAFFSSRVPTKQLFDTDPTTLVLYVDPDSGSDSNIGTRASPMATLSGAIAFAGTSNLILRLKETEFDYLHGFAGSVPSCLKLQIETWDGGRAIASTRVKGLTWASNGSGGYTTTLPGSVDCACVFDAANPTAAGDYGYLAKLGSAAAVNAAAASWYSTGAGGTLTVHTVDSRAPDSNIRVYASWSPFANLRTTGPWTYIENVDFEGSGNSSYGCVNSATGISTTQIFLELLSCSFKYSNTNGVSVAGYCGVIHKDCVAAQNWNDGFNYHWDVRTSLAPQIIEINPVSRGGGFAKDGSSNASTNHQAGLAVTLNANYISDNAVVADVSGSQRWLLGGTVGPKHLNGDADAYGGDALVMAGNTGDVVASTTVLDNVVLVGDSSYSDIYASVSGSAAYYTNCRFQAGGVTPTKTGGSTATAISRASGPLLGYANVPSAVPVASLPTTAKVGTVMTVTDGAAALSWGATVSGGGSVCYGVRWNGSNWTVYAK